MYITWSFSQSKFMIIVIAIVCYIPAMENDRVKYAVTRDFYI